VELGVWKPTAGDQFGLAANPRGAAAMNRAGFAGGSEP
jgi:hypothetical protein